MIKDYLSGLAPIWSGPSAPVHVPSRGHSRNRISFDNMDVKLHDFQSKVQKWTTRLDWPHSGIFRVPGNVPMRGYLRNHIRLGSLELIFVVVVAKYENLLFG